MVIDSSALIAILFGEPEAQGYSDAIADDSVRLMAAPNVVETGIVIENTLGEDGRRELELLLYKAKIKIEPFDADQTDIALEAYRQYGKGQHPAGLNFGDCFSYALSKSSGEPLLFKGNDFSKTDIKPAVNR